MGWRRGLGGGGEEGGSCLVMPARFALLTCRVGSRRPVCVRQVFILVFFLPFFFNRFFCCDTRDEPWDTSSALSHCLERGEMLLCDLNLMSYARPPVLAWTLLRGLCNLPPPTPIPPPLPPGLHLFSPMESAPGTASRVGSRLRVRSSLN